MAKLRSPNYPNRNLEMALGLAQTIFAEDGRNKISREVLARHMGHDALTGPALGKIGALRAYGIIEGAGDELRISEDAISALMAPLGSDARREAVRRLALNPTLFQDIRKEFPGKVSVESLTYWLIRNKFLPDAAPIAARTYFETMEFAGGLEAGNSTPDEPLAPMPDTAAKALAPAMTLAATPQPVKQPGVNVMDGERIAFTEEGRPGQYLKLIASGEVDDGLLEALEDFVKRQRKRIGTMKSPVGQVPPEWAFKEYMPFEQVPVGGVYSLKHKGHQGVNELEFSVGRLFPTCAGCDEDVRYKYDRPPGTPHPGNQDLA